MKTQQEAVEFIKSLPGKGFDTDLKNIKNDYGKQCVALVSYYYTWLGYESIMKNNAIMLWENVNSPNWTKVNDGGQPGDIFIIKNNFLPYGHTGLVFSVNDTSFTSVDQNWVNYDMDKGSDAAQVVHKKNEWVVGFIRPNFAKEGEQPMTKQEAIAILDAFYGRFTTRKVKQSELDEYVPILTSGYPDNFFKKAVEFDEVKNTIGQKLIDKGAVINWIDQNVK